MPNLVEVKVTPPVGTIILNRPDYANAVSMAVVAELRQAISDLYQEKRVRAAILTGAGSAFCAGRDLAEMAAEHPADGPDVASQQQGWGDTADELCDLIGDVLHLSKPVIAVVNGPVGGFGVALVMASDLVLACEAAELSVPDARYGLVAGLTAPLLAYRVGPSAAARLAIVGQTFTSAEAHRVGIYHELVSHDLLWARGMEVGSQVAACAPQAVGLSKRLLMETAGEKLLTDLASGAIAMATARTTDSASEGLQAFIEGRQAEWE